MSLIFWTQAFLIILFSLFAYLILKRRSYLFISGFATRPEEEQQQLIDNGYPQGVGRMFLMIAAGLLLLMPLGLTGFRYTFEVQMAFMMLVLFGGFIILSRREVPHKRKRALLTSVILTAVVIGGTSALLFTGARQPDVTFGESAMEISGMYGEKIRYRDIRSAELLDTMPTVRYKENGFGFADFSKGHFSVEGHGSSLLFVDSKQTPILLIETSGRPVFLTGSEPEETKSWHNRLQDKTN
ncbi:hypothetical protein AV656_10490 [Bhargavaea cecembensis]|uniref:Bacterial Pleckstrin homology domain-containing protein n=1 Tax=Bhargavaea cecembensis TaxID=394098 RepID=A0A165GMU5_9BACL|nr:DUF3784 domain-containing protein [Bhargavaea cecembensis]KZE37004.1 hypothetical protein AV656_10490 [Bhargavaea cecembensis]